MTVGVERAALGGMLTMTTVIPNMSRVDGVWAYGQYIPVPRGSYWYNEVDSTLRQRGRSGEPAVYEVDSTLRRRGRSGEPAVYVSVSGRRALRAPLWFAAL